MDDFGLPPPPQTDEDRQIVLITRQLYRELGIHDVTANYVTWKDTFFLGKAPPEYARLWLGEVSLPAVLRGKLSADEWRPLLASTLCYYRILSQRTMRNIGKFVLLPMLVFTVLIGVLFGIVDHNLIVQLGPSTFLGWTFGIAFAILFLGLGLMTSTQRRLRLDADLEASKLVGKENLHKALERVRGITRGPSILVRLRMQPSLETRIQKL